MRLVRPFRRSLLCALAAVASASLAVPAAPAAPAAPPATTVEVRPGALPRGAAPSFPVLVGRTIVDGERRVHVDAEGAYLLGASGSGYVVVVPGGGAGALRVIRVRPDASRKVLVRRLGADEVLLSADGAHLVRQRVLLAGARHRSLTRVVDARSGELLAERTFPGVRDVLDLDGGRAVVSGDRGRPTVLWDLTAGAGSADVTRGSVRTISAEDAYFADLATGRMAYYTRDPYDGGCSVLTTVAQPRTSSWRSCDWRVQEVDPTGRRVAVVDILADGVGPSKVQVRTQRGRPLSTYRGAGWFGATRFESASSLVLHAHGRQRSAFVRCDGDDCERATRATRTPRL